MALTGLLILTCPSQVMAGRLRSVLLSASKHVQRTLYVHLDPGKQKLWPIAKNANCSDFQQSCLKLVNLLYVAAQHSCFTLDVRVLLDGLKYCSSLQKRSTKYPFDIVLMDTNHQRSEVTAFLNESYCENSHNIPVILIPTEEESSMNTSFLKDNSITEWKKYNNVVLGGTFDGLHNGHKILLTNALLHCQNSLTVGVTDDNMIKKKILSELVRPTSNRIELVKDFLQDIDPRVELIIPPIPDPFGPSVVDPNLECIVVSEETVKGGEKVNEERAKKGLNQLDVLVVKLMEDENHPEDKVSSYMTRKELLGTRLRMPEIKPGLPLKPYIVGLTGGIASGKTAISKRLEGLGASVINADLAAHETYVLGTSTYDKIVEFYGKEVVGADGQIDRKVLGQKVFSDKSSLEKLNSIVWPALEDLLKSRIAEHTLKGTQILVLEAAVLIESGLTRLVHEVWVTIIPEAEAIQRIQDRNKISEAAAKQRVDAQLPNTVKVAHATVVLSSLWEPTYTQKQVEKAWLGLQEYLSTKEKSML